MRKDQLYLESKFGFEKAEFFWNIGLDAVKNVTNLISKYNIDCALKPGILHAGNTKKDYKYFLEEIEHMKSKYSYDNYEYFDENSIKDEVNTDQYYSGLLTNDSFHLNPLKLTYGLANQCLNKGISIFENSPIDKIEEKDNNILLFSKNAVIKSKKVIVACNGYLDNLLGLSLIHI